MISENEFKLLYKKCQELPPAKGNYLVNDYIENLMLTVLDYQMHETSIKKAIGYYKTNRLQGIRDFEDLKRLLSLYPDNKEGNTLIAQYLWNNNYWNRIALLRKLALFFGSNDITTQAKLREWAERSNFEKDFEGRVPGMGYAIYQWIIMRQAIETIKPDTHVINFVNSTIGRAESYRKEIVAKLMEIATQMGIKAYELDWRIWEYQRSLNQNKTDK